MATKLRTRTILWAILLLLTLSLCLNPAQAEESFALNLTINFHGNLIFSRYNAKMKLDNELITIIQHGGKYIDSLTVTAGKHTLAFYKEDNDKVNGQIEIDVKGTSFFSCTISATRSAINISDVDFRSAEPENEKELKERAVTDADYSMVVPEEKKGNEDIVITYEDAPYLKGRGYIDVIGAEPYYVGIYGYVVTGPYDGMNENHEYNITPWQVNKYAKIDGNWVEDGKINHKTKVAVVSQELEKKNGKEYQGYLEVIEIDSGNREYIKVSNFCTSEYWKESMNKINEKGYCIAAYSKKSSFDPINQKNKAVKIKNKTRVLIPMKGTFYVSSPDVINHSVPGIVPIEKDGNQVYDFVFFNSGDLNVEY